MPLMPAKCTNCGGNLEVESARDAAICPHCGSAFITEKAINNYNTYNQIHADTVIVQGERDFEISGGVLKAYHGADVDVVVPDGVYEIGKECFKGMRIRSVVLPDGVEKIGDLAFYEDESLKSIRVPESLKEIGSVAFYGCMNLQSIELPENLQKVGYKAFSKCTSLFDLFLPKGLHEIPDYVFEGSGIQKVRIPEKIKKIGHHAFADCSNLREVSLPEGLLTIGDGAFSNCISLTDIHFPESLQTINDYAFTGCTGLTSVCLPKNLRKFRFDDISSVFSECNNLQQVSHFFGSDEELFYGSNFAGTPVYDTYQWKRQKRCSHCGGEFKGMFTKVCSKCGRPKDY